MKRLITIACLAALAGCAGDTDDAQRAQQEQREQWAAQNQSLIYSFPDEGQIEVPVSSPIVLRFSSPVVETAPEITLTEVGGDPVTGLDMEWVDNNRGMIITPGSNLKPMTDYMVDVPAIELEKGTAQARSIAFSTRALFEGPKSQLGTDTFEIIRMIPDGEQYQIMDFSSFRLQFSQPLDRSTARYGNSAESTVQLMGPNGLVDAHLLVSGRYMTIDPKSELTPGAHYSLNITTGLASIYGDTLPGGSFGNPNDPLAVRFPITPQDTGAPGTGERALMVQDVADTGELSMLTGKPINLVPMASLLLGDDTAMQASGMLAAELAFAPNFPDETPFRVKRGSLIEGASIDVLIGGEVPAGFDSGDVRIEFLSDAVGYMLPNRYSGLDDVPRAVRLFMDLAISTSDSKANGAINQNILHIELVGTAIVEDGHLTVNAVGMVEPELLGSERAKSLLSFYMKGQPDAPAPAEDTVPPQLVSWTPGPNPDESFGMSDSIQLVFDKPVSAEGASIQLRENGAVIATKAFVDGTTLVIKPMSPFQPSNETLTNTYTISIFGVEDIHGNAQAGGFEASFTAPLVVDEIPEGTGGTWGDGTMPTREVQRSPMLLSIYPGYPCLLDESERNLPDGIQGHCAGGFPGWDTGSEFDVKEQDDAIPLPVLPANRPIIAQFSKDIDPQSAVLGSSFEVVEVDASGTVLSAVTGSLRVSGKVLEFYPDIPWEEGTYYRYTLRSNGDPITNVATCDGSISICSNDGLPLQTNILGELYVTDELWDPVPGAVFEPERETMVIRTPYPPNGGGQDMVQYFKGAANTTNVLQALRTAPVVDTNANFFLDVDDTSDVFPPTTVIMPYYNYLVGERIPDKEIDPNADPLHDPNGLKPSPNSAKIYSTNKLGLPPGENPVINGGVIGCGYAGFVPEAGYPNQDFPMPVFTPIPMDCPERKFTYLTGALTAEVTGEKGVNGELKVHIWPSIVAATSLDIRTNMLTMPLVFKVASGPQFMRMRYEDNGLGERVNPITGWITDGPDGKPILEATVDLYLDAPYTKDFATVFEEPTHNLVSYPITMHLSGEIDFLPDGRMVIEQYNLNEVDINLLLHTPDGARGGFLDLRIPAYGNRLQFVSELVKK